MSSHNRTPTSVLNAPTLTPIQLSLQLGIINGPTRVERRHVQYRPRGKTFLIPKAARPPATNVPLLRHDPGQRRGKKAMRHAARRPR